MASLWLPSRAKTSVTTLGASMRLPTMLRAGNVVALSGLRICSAHKRNAAVSRGRPAFVGAAER